MPAAPERTRPALRAPASPARRPQPSASGGRELLPLAVRTMTAHPPGFGSNVILGALWDMLLNMRARRGYRKAINSVVDRLSDRSCYFSPAARPELAI